MLDNCLLLHSYFDYNVRIWRIPMKTATIRLFILFCTVALSLAAFADDQDKATKEIKKITSISVDSNMRAIVNRTMADMLKAKRLDLVKDRQVAGVGGVPAVTAAGDHGVNGGRARLHEAYLHR